MSKKLLSMLTACAFAAAATAANACPGTGCQCGAKASNAAGVKTAADQGSAPCAKSAGSPCSKGSVTLVAAKADDRIEAVLAKLPKMQYRVGDEVTGCSKAAAQMAEQSQAKIVYLVGDKSFESEGDAKVALTAALQAEIDNLKAMQFAVGEKCVRCPVTAKSMAQEAGGKIAYRVGGADFTDKERAEKALKLVADAADAVKIAYKVGDKSFCCDKMAGAHASEAGKQITFVVGDEETPCKVTAELMLTQAKIHAIIAAAAAAIAS